MGMPFPAWARNNASSKGGTVPASVTVQACGRAVHLTHELTTHLSSVLPLNELSNHNALPVPPYRYSETVSREIMRYGTSP
jgi:hypothetical protein